MYLPKKKTNNNDASKGKTERNTSNKRYRFSNENMACQDRPFIKKSENTIRYSSKLEINLARKLFRNKSKAELKNQTNLENRAHRRDFS